MTRTFTFQFDELPLTILNGFECGLVAGSADLSYNRDGEWGIESISLDGRKRDRWTLEQIMDHNANGTPLPPTLTHKSIQLDEGDPIYLAIYHRLENEWAGDVQEAVHGQIAEDRADALEARAEARRDDRTGAW